MGNSTFVIIIIILISFALYFLPSIIAILKRKSNMLAIILLNVFLGWTFIGWLVSLIWSVTNDIEESSIVINNNNNLTPEKNNNYQNSPNQSVPYQELNLLNSNESSHLASQNIPNKITHLKEIKELFDDGILSKEEFEQQKTKILNN